MARRRVSYTEKQIAKAYTALFSGPAGEVVLWDLMDRFIWRSAVPANFDTNQFFYNEGRRAIVLEIIEMTKRGEPHDNAISADAHRDPASTSTEFDPTGRPDVGDDDSTRGSKE